VRAYFVVIFVFFSGLFPLTFLSGGIIPIDGYNYFLTLIVGVLIPLAFKGSTNINAAEFRNPLFLILAVMTLRFVLDAFTTSTVITGPWRLEYLSGLFYLVYFVFHKHMTQENVHCVIRYFIRVATVVSSVNILQWLFPNWAIFSGLTSFSEHTSDVGGSFVRFQTIYFHFGVLAVLLVACLLTSPESTSLTRPFLLMSFLFNSVAVMINGYRATMYVLLGCLLLYFIHMFSGMTRRARSVALLTTIPLILVIYLYAQKRNAETETPEGDESSLVYRLVEAGAGIEKLDQDNAWLCGIGYRDGMLNPWGGTPGGLETFFLHNGYVSILYNYGIVGSIAWGYLIVSVSAFVIRHYSQNRTSGLYVILGLYLFGQLAVNYSSGIFNREPPVTFCYLFAVSLIEKITLASRARQEPRGGLLL
jgi:hypothetical protein